jgi:hypothetical protein
MTDVYEDRPSSSAAIEVVEDTSSASINTTTVTPPAVVAHNPSNIIRRLFHVRQVEIPTTDNLDDDSADNRHRNDCLFHPYIQVCSESHTLHDSLEHTLWPVAGPNEQWCVRPPPHLDTQFVIRYESTPPVMLLAERRFDFDKSQKLARKKFDALHFDTVMYFDRCVHICFSRHRQ